MIILIHTKNKIIRKILFKSQINHLYELKHLIKQIKKNKNQIIENMEYSANNQNIIEFIHKIILNVVAKQLWYKPDILSTNIQLSIKKIIKKMFKIIW